MGDCALYKYPILIITRTMSDNDIWTRSDTWGIIEVGAAIGLKYK